MIWADRIGLTLVAMTTFSALMLGLVLLVGVGTFSDMRLNRAILDWTAMGVLVFALPAWVLLRGLDLIAGGPGRRRARRERQTRKAPSFTDDDALLLTQIAKPAGAPNEAGE